MPSVEGPFHCTVCGSEFNNNPRTERWLTGRMPEDYMLTACLCWLCNRLRVSAVREAEMEGGVSD